MDFGVTSKLGGYYLVEQYQKKGATGKSSGVSFAELAATKATEKGTAVEMSFKDMWQARFPGAYYHTMDASNIPQGVWERNDFPFEKFFQNNVDESVLNWKPSGAEPAMSDPKVQDRIRSTIGKKSIIVPPALEEKMKNDPELSQKVMAKVEKFIAEHDAVQIHREGYFPNPCKGYLISLDENGEIAHFCITSESFSISSSEFVEARKAREAKHTEYKRLAEENALKRKMLAQETDRRYYQSKAVLAAAYEVAGILK
ncbi:MAG: hypothetical protein K2N82_12450 [Lachnospiraceae bacterium]|nr:hypothetical protein [Lachnospiraceae bacterium]